MKERAEDYSRAQGYTFFEAYRQAFEHGDAEQIAGFYAEKLMVSSQTGTFVLENNTTFRMLLQAAVKLYQAAGFLGTRLTLFESNELDPHHLQTHVRWELVREGGGSLLELDMTYIVRSAKQAGGEKDEPKLVFVLAHQELEALKEALGQLGPEAGAAIQALFKHKEG